MAHTSQAGSLSAKFSEKLKIAGVKASGGDFKVGASDACVCSCAGCAAVRPAPSTTPVPGPTPQELNVAVIKATTNQFHVVPKEKHVRSECSRPCQRNQAGQRAAAAVCVPGVLLCSSSRLVTCASRLPCLSPPPCPAALKLAVHPGRPRRDIVHVISELHNRLQDATDWLVRPCRAADIGGGAGAAAAPAVPATVRG